jgi:uncharacterized protein YjaG (DUF416 family)
LSELGFTGLGEKLKISITSAFNCQNQDIQDLRIYRMLLDDFWWGVGDFNCLNQDFQDLRIFRMLLDDFWWGVGDFSGCF